tara:strand:- start:1159 stop:1347 length:189 start_codon:yes stop_codon:yes gene_type:complete
MNVKEFREKYDIEIHRTEQWEYTATGFGKTAEGSDSNSAELNLLRKVIDECVLGCKESQLIK